MVKIKSKIVYSAVVIAVVFLIMTVFNIYEEKKITNNYKVVTLKEFKYDRFNNRSQNRGSKNELVKIHISGAVKNPGFYDVSPGVKLKRVIEETVILRDNAAVDELDLSKKLYSKDQIIIPHS